jgi:hypothetical protein
MKLPRIFALLLSVAILSSCNSDSENACKDWQTRADSLQKLITAKEAQLNEISTTMDEVESNLGSVQQSQEAIENIKKEKQNPDSRERINVYIEQIRSTIIDNASKVAELERKFKNSQANSAGMRKLIARLKEIIRLKEVEIDSMGRANANLVTKIDRLSTTISNKDAEISNKQQEIERTKNVVEALDKEKNAAFVYIGTEKELIGAGIIEKKGGVLGMGKTKRLVANFDKSKFKNINIKQATEIDLGVVEKSTLVSTHPSESYTIVSANQRATLKIIDPGKFWSVSRYLVIEVK